MISYCPPLTLPPGSMTIVTIATIVLLWMIVGDCKCSAWEIGRTSGHLKLKLKWLPTMRLLRVWDVVQRKEGPGPFEWMNLVKVWWLCHRRGEPGGMLDVSLSFPLGIIYGMKNKSQNEIPLPFPDPSPSWNGLHQGHCEIILNTHRWTVAATRRGEVPSQSLLSFDVSSAEREREREKGNKIYCEKWRWMESRMPLLQVFWLKPREITMKVLPTQRRSKKNGCPHCQGDQGLNLLAKGVRL